MAFVRPEDWEPQGIDELEEAAWEALRTTDQATCVSAGAGAGKTEFLAQKAAYLLQTGICRNPQRILAISFKRDAASNLEKRVRERCPQHAHRFVSLTFDAFTKGLIDRFRLAIPTPYTPAEAYQLVFHYTRELREFLDNQGFHGVNTRSFSMLIDRTVLPLPGVRDSALRTYWRERYHSGELTFPMINRLVERLIREHSSIRKALRSTYSFVFLDEFQDTTYAQFELLVTAFGGSASMLTAVGDRKQCIMGWAGAMDDSFGEFEQQFGAQTVELLSNWRSHAELVRVQHAIAEVIDPATPIPHARSARKVDGDVSAIWTYPTIDDETEGLAAWVAAEVQAGIPPEEFAILVRNNVHLVEEQLEDEFRDRGIPVRNVARNVGEIAIQDVLEEPLTEVLLPFYKLGSHASDAASWRSAYHNLLTLHQVDGDDERNQTMLQASLQNFVRALRQMMNGRTPTAESLETIDVQIVSFLGQDLLKSLTPAYGRQRDFDRVWEGFKALMLESVTSADSWPEALDRFEGKGQIALMTVHKSKGLEFHTIIFHGLDNQTWWSLTQNNPEELRAFFVAFTRAKQRAFFTLCAERGQGVGWIEHLLAQVEVRRIPGP